MCLLRVPFRTLPRAQEPNVGFNPCLSSAGRGLYNSRGSACSGPCRTRCLLSLTSAQHCPWARLWSGSLAEPGCPWPALLPGWRVGQALPCHPLRAPAVSILALGLLHGKPDTGLEPWKTQLTSPLLLPSLSNPNAGEGMATIHMRMT